MNYEKICKFYNEYFINWNLKIFYKIIGENIKWMNINDININDKTLDQWNDKDDKFVYDIWLDNMKDNKMELGLDILKNGTYWPFTISDNNNKVLEGKHRIYSIKLLYKEGIWPENKKLFTIRFPDKIALTVKDFHQKNIVDSSLKINPIKMYCSFSNGLNKHIKKKFVKNNIVDVFDNKNIHLIEINNLHELYHIIIVFPTFFRDYMFNLKKEGKMVKPNHVINNEEIFNKWRRSELICN
ncbi:MAG: hypothetical protein ACOCP8_00840 [archaeon]